MADTESRWYCVSAQGIPMLCASKEDAEREAKRNDKEWPTGAPHRAVQLCDAAERDRLRADVRELVEFVRQFNGCAYPVAKEIDPRGHRWSEIWLDHALRVSTALLAKHNPLQALVDNARELGLSYEDKT